MPNYIREKIQSDKDKLKNNEKKGGVIKMHVTICNR